MFGEFTKTIARNLKFSFEETWVTSTRRGFDNLGTSFKYQFVRDAGRELAMSVSLDADWGGTGAKSIGAEPFTTLTPTWFSGKGFGFLPDNLKLLRPLAVTTELGYSFPTQSSTTEFADGVRTRTRNPQFLVWGGSLQYSMPYLKARVRNLDLPEFVNRFVPITEFSFTTQTTNFDGDERTTGRVNPGLLYIADKYQLGVEAIIPINRASGDRVGVIGNLHLFLEDIFPNSLGRPLFASAGGEVTRGLKRPSGGSPNIDAPRHARGHGSFPSLASSPRVSERSWHPLERAGRKSFAGSPGGTS